LTTLKSINKASIPHQKNIWYSEAFRKLITNSVLVSLIIPAYNEERTVGNVIESTAKIMDKLGLHYEIIVINDGSTDKTEWAASLQKCNQRVFSNKSNRGKGYCLRRAVEYSKGDIIVTLDSDGEHKPEEIPNLLAPLFQGKDIVAGSRFLGSSQYVTTKLNLLGNHIFNIAIMALTGRSVSDSQTGFRAIKRDVFKKLNLESDRYEIETEITVKSLKNGFSFVEVPISVEKRRFDASKIHLLSDGKKILTTIIRSSFSNIE
jgi:dolichol-phosphate hexosyltransferase